MPAFSTRVFPLSTLTFPSCILEVDPGGGNVVVGPLTAQYETLAQLGTEAASNVVVGGAGTMAGGVGKVSACGRCTSPPSNEAPSVEVKAVPFPALQAPTPVRGDDSVP